LSRFLIFGYVNVGDLYPSCLTAGCYMGTLIIAYAMWMLTPHRLQRLSISSITSWDCGSIWSCGLRFLVKTKKLYSISHLTLIQNNMDKRNMVLDRKTINKQKKIEKRKEKKEKQNKNRIFCSLSKNWPESTCSFQRAHSSELYLA